MQTAKQAWLGTFPWIENPQNLFPKLLSQYNSKCGCWVHLLRCNLQFDSYDIGMQLQWAYGEFGILNNSESLREKIWCTF